MPVASARRQRDMREHERRTTLCAALLIALAVTLLAVLVIGAALALRGSVAEHARFALDIHRFNVPGETVLAFDDPQPEHEPSARGIVRFDALQELMMWRLDDDYTLNGINITDIRLHGVLHESDVSHTHNDERPLAYTLTLPTTRKRVAQRFVDRVSLPRAMIQSILRRPTDFYIAFYAGASSRWREVGRDYFNKRIK